MSDTPTPAALPARLSLVAKRYMETAFELEQTIAALRAELVEKQKYILKLERELAKWPRGIGADEWAEATAWVPVSDGMIYHYTDSIAAEWNYPAHTESIEFLEVRDNGTTIACGSMPIEDEHVANPPDDVRLCRRVATP